MESLEDWILGLFLDYRVPRRTSWLKLALGLRMRFRCSIAYLGIDAGKGCLGVKRQEMSLHSSISIICAAC